MMRPWLPPRTSATRQKDAGNPFFCWWNGTRMHFRTHVREEHRHKGNDEYTDGMIEHDAHVGELLKFLDDNGLSDNTSCSIARTTAALQQLAGRRAPRPSAARRTATGRAPTACPPSSAGRATSRRNVTLNGIVSHEDWLPTFAAASPGL